MQRCFDAPMIAHGARKCLHTWRQTGDEHARFHRWVFIALLTLAEYHANAPQPLPIRMTFLELLRNFNDFVNTSFDSAVSLLFGAMTVMLQVRTTAVQYFAEHFTNVVV